MLRVDRKEELLTPIPKTRVVDQGWLEDELEKLIARNPEAFFGEIEESILLVKTQAKVGEVVDDRIDILGIDRRGTTCIVELKRGDHKLQLLQAVAYAGMVSDWQAERLVELYSAQHTVSREDAMDEILTFAGVASVEEINQDQRILLIADEYDEEVLAAAKWLHERYGVAIKCYQLAHAVDGEAEYLQTILIYPMGGITRHMKKRGRRSQEIDVRSWAESCAFIEEEGVRKAFLAEGERGVERKSGRRPVLFYRVGGKRRFDVSGRKRGGYLWQKGRFDGDQEYWAREVGVDSKPEPVKNGQALRMFLRSGEAFELFLDALKNLGNREWLIESAEDADFEDDDGGENA